MGKGRTRQFTEKELQTLKKLSISLSVRNVRRRTTPRRVIKMQKNHRAWSWEVVGKWIPTAFGSELLHILNSVIYYNFKMSVAGDFLTYYSMFYFSPPVIPSLPHLPLSFFHTSPTPI